MDSDAIDLRIIVILISRIKDSHSCRDVLRVRYASGVEPISKRDINVMSRSHTISKGDIMSCLGVEAISKGEIMSCLVYKYGFDGHYIQLSGSSPGQ